MTRRTRPGRVVPLGAGHALPPPPDALRASESVHSASGGVSGHREPPRAAEGPPGGVQRVRGGIPTGDSRRSGLEDRLAASMRAAGLPEPERQYRFHPTRRWLLDFAFVDQRLAVEIEGGAYRGPGHRSVGVFLRNIEKYNTLTLAGWRLLRFASDQVRSGEATAVIAQALAPASASDGAGEG